MLSAKAAHYGCTPSGRAAAPSPTSQQNPQGDEHLRIAAQTFGLQQKSALTTTDIPMPTDYGRQVVELVWQYGQFRKYATRYRSAR